MNLIKVNESAYDIFSYQKYDVKLIMIHDGPKNRFVIVSAFKKASNFRLL